ncbi:hypothetical protein NE172_05130 [Clostridium botulinum]|uniref:Uncharacterized protein n=1 Tax=Clostridium botulinum TaxID=1491 RepID=A0A6B4JJ99_CLOBO|nr:DUF6731 family protein [Clostridium botulinum]EES49378.1 hypothetical protein CLO_1396 [Clostridium botulinum E1 str. 'BoNT E Beluga']MBY6760544.1 hypothetical protein [Clostridium botulinum]MBY6919451.1 hypothetical protein [Clostridium botulinum]MCR1130329.1 hypothetical protein [Clostridium botulinum]NFJ56912.1 hypothetical protein [Clostridium botulinum]
MAKKKFTINYLYPVLKVDAEIKLLDLKDVLRGLKELKPEERILPQREGNIQLKKIEYCDSIKRWHLGFLRNGTDAPFKSKLDDNTESAEPLEDDEFVGQECCMIYDEVSGIIALQNNIRSISVTGLNQFFRNFMNNVMYLSVITYKEKYCDISDDELINYKSLIIGFTDVSKLQEIADSEDEKSIKDLAKLASDMSAINGKLELNVGRTKQYLGKFSLKNIVHFFKCNREVTKGLKVKMVDNDVIRMIDLLNNKVTDNAEIAVTKTDPKTFDKILYSMNSNFDVALEEVFDKCNLYKNS